MRVLFVSFQENSDVIGVKYLHAYLRSKDHESAILLVPGEGSADVAAAEDYVVAYRPEALCYSAMSYEFDRARRFARELRERFDGCPTVIGGIHATADPEACLDVADVVVRGEGEETLVELLEVLRDGRLDGLDAVAGIVFKRDGQVVHTPVRPPMQDPDTLPYPGHLPEAMAVVHGGRVRPLRDPAIRKRYVRYRGTFLSVVSSRGCPYACTYCCNSALKGLYGATRVRMRDADRVVDEIVQEVREFPGILYVNFQDDCFLMHPIEWVARFAERYGKEVGIPFIVRTTPRHITREKLEVLKAAGLRWVFMGLQTGSDRVNEQVYQRYVTAEQFLEAARTISSLGLCPWYDIILDNPYETEQDHLATIDLLLRTPHPFQFDLFSLDYFPGTELRRRALADGIPVPALGEKSYTEPEPNMMNRYIRMTASLPPWLVGPLVKARANPAGKLLGLAAYGLSMAVEPFVYLWLIFRSNDCSVARTARVVNAFYLTAIKKLLLRQQG